MDFLCLAWEPKGHLQSCFYGKLLFQVPNRLQKNFLECVCQLQAVCICILTGGAFKRSKRMILIIGCEVRMDRQALNDPFNCIWYIDAYITAPSQA